MRDHSSTLEGVHPSTVRRQLNTTGLKGRVAVKDAFSEKKVKKKLANENKKSCWCSEVASATLELSMATQLWGAIFFLQLNMCMCFRLPYTVLSSTLSL